jgi:hypothetical protein
MVKGYWPEDIKARNGSPPGPYVPMSDYDSLLADDAKNQARIRELEDSLAKYQAARVHDVDEKAWLSKRVTELEAALRKYGHHPTGCSDYREELGRCTCGLDAALGSQTETKGEQG